MSVPGLVLVEVVSAGVSHRWDISSRNCTVAWIDEVFSAIINRHIASSLVHIIDKQFYVEYQYCMQSCINNIVIIVKSIAIMITATPFTFNKPIIRYQLQLPVFFFLLISSCILFRSCRGSTVRYGNPWSSIALFREGDCRDLEAWLLLSSWSESLLEVVNVASSWLNTPMTEAAAVTSSLERVLCWTSIIDERLSDWYNSLRCYNCCVTFTKLKQCTWQLQFYKRRESGNVVVVHVW